MQAWQWLWDLPHKHRVAPIRGQEKASFTDGNVAMLFDSLASALPNIKNGNARPIALNAPKRSARSWPS